MIPNSKIWGKVKSLTILSPIETCAVLTRRSASLTRTTSKKHSRRYSPVIDGDTRTLKEEPTRVDVVSLGDSSVNIIIQAWYRREDWWQAKLDFTKNVKLALDEAGISIPYPQSEVTFQKGASGLEHKRGK